MDHQPSDKVQAAGAAIGALVGEAIVGPGGAIIGAAATPHLTTVVHRAYGELRGQREQSAARVLGGAADHLAADPDHLVTAALQRDDTAQHLSDALVAGANTLFDWKVAALARSLANGLAEDGARVDEEGVILRALRDLEPPHVKTLRLIRWMPYQRDQLCRPLGVGTGTVAAVLATLERHALVESDALKEQEERMRKVTDQLDGGVVRGGRVNSNAHRPAWKATDFGRTCLDYLIEFPADTSEDT